MPMKDEEDIVRFLNEKKNAFIIFGRWEGWLSFVNNRVMKKIHGLFPTLDNKKKENLGQHIVESELRSYIFVGNGE